MKKSMIYLLVIVVIAGVVGTLAARDPGYVLISYAGKSLQTGLWVFLGAIALLAFVLWFLGKSLRGIAGTTKRIQNWRHDRQLGKSIEHTNRGLLYLQEGNAGRAEKFLTSGIKHQPQPVVNYLHLARAANEAAKPDDREKYFRLALESDPTAKTAIAMTRAELATDREDWQACLDALADVPLNQRSISLKKDALIELGRWGALEKLMPQLKKMLDPGGYEALEKRLVLEVIGAEKSSDEKRLAIYRGASESVRHDLSILESLCLHMGYEKESEAILRRVLKKTWQPRLVELYGGLGKETLSKRLKTALAWQKQHPVDASLEYCLGLLHETLDQKDQAMKYYESAVEHGGHRAASRQLANLHAFVGDHQKSNEYLNMAFKV
jgi:HemY protein